MYPILGRYGPFFLYSFTVIMGLGLLASIGVTAWQVGQDRWSGWFNGLLVSLSAGLIGGRVGFVVIQWRYFQERPSEVWQVWQGGLTYHGSLLAGLAGLWVWCAWRGRSFEQVSSLLAPGFALANAFGWLACWFEGCAFGREAAVGPLTADLPDTFGVFAVRFQTQLIGAGLSSLAFLIVLWLSRNRPSAKLFWFTLFGLSVSRVVVALLRGDLVPQLATIRMDIVGDSAIALTSLILLQYRRKKRPVVSAAVAPQPGPFDAGQVNMHEDQNET